MPGIKYKGTDGQWHLLNNVMVNQINVVQTTGTSSADVMSQSAVTEAVSGINEVLTAHTSDGGIHLTSTEKTNLDSLTGSVGTMAYENTSSYSSATEVSNALSAKVNSATYTGHTADTTAHFSGDEKTNLDSLATNIETISGITATDKLIHETMNRRTRTKFTNRDDFFANLRRAAVDQNLEKYGLKVGDYLNYNGHDYVIAGLNTMRGPRETYRVTTDHIGLIVIPHTTQAWNVSGNTYQSTHTYSTGGTWSDGTGAGYANSDLHHYMTETLLPIVNNDLGSSYSGGVLTHYKIYSNAVNTSGYNRFGSPGGCSSSWAWYANQKICALSEIQVYGSIVWSSSGYDTGEACRQLDVFRVYNMNEIFGNEYPWLRDVASSSNACFVGSYGDANYDTASHASLSVAALILFA